MFFKDKESNERIFYATLQARRWLPLLNLGNLPWGKAYDELFVVRDMIGKEGPFVVVYCYGILERDVEDYYFGPPEGFNHGWDALLGIHGFIAGGTQFNPKFIVSMRHLDFARIPGTLAEKYEDCPVFEIWGKSVSTACFNCAEVTKQQLYMHDWMMPFYMPQMRKGDEWEPSDDYSINDCISPRIKSHGRLIHPDISRAVKNLTVS